MEMPPAGRRGSMAVVLCFLLVVAVPLDLSVLPDVLPVPVDVAEAPEDAVCSDVEAAPRVISAKEVAAALDSAAEEAAEESVGCEEEAAALALDDAESLLDAAVERESGICMMFQQDALLLTCTTLICPP